MTLEHLLPLTLILLDEEGEKLRGASRPCNGSQQRDTPNPMLKKLGEANAALTLENIELKKNIAKADAVRLELNFRIL